MIIRHASKIKSSEITPKEVFLNRRSLLAGSGALALGGSILAPRTAQAAKLDYVPDPAPDAEKLTSYEDITSYNNFYEFGLDKGDAKKYGDRLTTKPWSVTVDGMVDAPGEYALEDLIPPTLEERVYRFRCVEAWSMVVPWIGFELSHILNKVGVQSSAKYVAFETLVRPEEFPGQKGIFQLLEWPYREGLRLDEAMHPLTILANGLYGEEIPNQNGAPLRLVVPWKYGFKSIKSIVRISLVDQQPPTSWNMQAPKEYGFYSNVNPTVDHPRWSQATERRVGGGLFAKRQDTLMFNGYEEEVAGLYEGMDLAKEY
ncbi:MAG: protein-methionine-sulfoxide reductase catalytic subunit MsrP [Pseudomonadota bacterium]